MLDIFIAITIGVVAGVIDVIPMFIKKMNFYANLSAFFHWVILGLIIPYVAWDMGAWLKGLLIAELTAIPIIFIVIKEDKKAVIPILFMSAVLGIGVGILSSIFIPI